jgi:tRNA(adenine34) deaminase
LNNQAQAATWEHESFMRRCLDLARRAAVSGDIWVGSLIVLKGQIIGEGTERVKAENDLAAHAEIEAIEAASRKLASQNLRGCSLYTTAEPCFMCSQLIRQTRISQVIFGRRVPDIGGVTSRFPILTDASFEKWSPPPVVVAGILVAECEQLLQKI